MVRLELREPIEKGCVLFMRYGGGGEGWQGKSFTTSWVLFHVFCISLALYPVP